MNDLQAAIEHLYRTFESYPLKPKIEGCPHCELDDVDSALHLSRLNALTWADLAQFIFKSMTTFGDEDDFKHFLPRIFELYLSDFRHAPYDFGVFLAKLDYAHWKQWPIEEQAAVVKCYETWIETLQASGSEENQEILEDIALDMSGHSVNFSL